MKEATLLRRINKIYPYSLSEPWDFPGFQCGVRNPKRDVKKVFLCLDFTEDCLEEVKRFRPDLILSHHPFFFEKRKDVLQGDPKKVALEKAVKDSGCALYSYHTNFDKGVGGINDTIFDVLGFPITSVSEDGLMRFSTLPNPVTMEELVDYCKDRLHLPFLLYLKGDKEKISKIAMVAGGDSSDYPKAFLSGADCYLSGDCPHHTRLEMRRYGYSYIELPHEVEEIGFLHGMKKALLGIDSELTIDAFGFERYFSIR